MTPDVKAVYGALRYFAGSDPVRDEKWLGKVREGKCVLCGKDGPCDPHHLFGSYAGKNGKTSDLFTVPLHRTCHITVEENLTLFPTLLVAWCEMAHDFIRETLENAVSRS